MTWREQTNSAQCAPRGTSEQLGEAVLAIDPTATSGSDRWAEIADRIHALAVEYNAAQVRDLAPTVRNVRDRLERVKQAAKELEHEFQWIDDVAADYLFGISDDVFESFNQFSLQDDPRYSAASQTAVGSDWPAGTIRARHEQPRRTLLKPMIDRLAAWQILADIGLAAHAKAFREVKGGQTNAAERARGTAKSEFVKGCFSLFDEYTDRSLDRAIEPGAPALKKSVDLHPDRCLRCDGARRLRLCRR